jgi:hypothetical protein
MPYGKQLFHMVSENPENEINSCIGDLREPYDKHEL